MAALREPAWRRPATGTAAALGRPWRRGMFQVAAKPEPRGKGVGEKE